ncbi:MAG: DUF4336 domain-containing protein [Deltaproteobacteria bacterium]|nr:DUF4336 domain-containing protein [Deltaproteobacteria bacterium]
MIKKFADNFWVAEDDKFSVGGLQIGSRMTIIRLNNGGLLIHSPIPLSKTIKDSIASIGPPKFVIAPNTIHNMFVKQFHDEYPDAELYIVQELRKKRHDLFFAKDLANELIYPWSEEIKQHAVAVMGIPKLGEFVFFHSSSKTLILTDLAFYITPEKPLFTRLLFHLNGVYDKFGPSRIFKNFILKDKSEFEKSIDYILGWDFERIIIAHGRIVEKDGKGIFKEAFNSLLKT